MIMATEPTHVEMCSANIQELPDLQGLQLMRSSEEGWPHRFYRPLTVTKGYIATTSIIKDILEEHSIQGKDQCVWC